MLNIETTTAKRILIRMIMYDTISLRRSHPLVFETMENNMGVIRICRNLYQLENALDIMKVDLLKLKEKQTVPNKAFQCITDCKIELNKIIVRYESYRKPRQAANA